MAETEVKIYEGAYATGEALDEVLTAAEAHVADQSVHVSEAQANAITAATAHAANSAIHLTQAQAASISASAEAVEALKKSATPINLLKTQRYATLGSGVRLTPKKDGTYAMGGTATAGVFFPYIGRLSDIPVEYVGQTLKLTGGVSSNVFLQVMNGSTAVYEDTGSGVMFTLTQAMLDYTIRLGVKKNAVMDNVILKPMLCVNGTSANFIPYTPANEEIREDIARFNTGRLKGSSYIALGDSIVEYQGTTGNPHPTKNFVYGYIEAIEDDYGVVCTNLGAAGHTINDDLAGLLAGDYSAATIVTIGYGVNDARLDLPLGETTDTYDAQNPTFCGALNALIAKIYSDNAFCNVIVLAPIQRGVVNDFGSFTPNSNGDTLEDFANACVAVAGYNATPCVDMFHNSGINANTLSSLLKDGVHPNTSGYKRMYAAMRAALANMVMPKD